MKQLLGILALLLSASLSFAQDYGSIKGRILDEKSEPVEFVNVLIKGTDQGDVSDASGTYEIHHIPAGDYTLIVSYVGYKSQRKTINVQNGAIRTIENITLQASDTELQEVIINSSKNRFEKKESIFVSKLPLKDIENPQVYNTISSELLKDQVITNFDDALKNAPGIDKLWESTGRGGDGAGYFSLRGFAVQPTMVNGLPGLSNGGLDPANIDRIEVIKGPSGTLYGSSLISYGGLINITTKRPYEGFGGELNYTAGSFGLNRFTADINTPLSQEKDLLLRVNSAFHTQNSFQDAGFRKSLFVAPSLSYKVNDRLSFMVNTELYEGETTNPTMLFLNRSNPLAYENLDELGYDNFLSYTHNDITIKNPSFNLQGQMNYAISDNWVSQTVISRSSAKSDGYYSYLFDRADGEGTFDRYVSKQNSSTLTSDIQQNFMGDFKLGSLRNRMVVGLDFYKEKTVNNSTGYVAAGSEQVGSDYTGSPSLPAIQELMSGATVNNINSEQQIYSAYASDVINWTPKLSTMLSLRLDHFDNLGNLNTDDDDYNQTTLSPKLGLVYQPVKDKVSLFANYMNGFSNVAPRIQNDGSTKTFRPEQANQWESGLKLNIWEDKLSATLSYYDILVSDVVREDPDQPNFFIQEGENYSRGVEVDIIANPIDGLSIIAGYSRNESKVTNTDNEIYLNRRPEGAGPENLVNFWASYRITRGQLNGLGVGFGGNYASENKIMNRNSTGVFALPAYTVLNGSIWYQIESFQMALKVNNITDKEYYKGWTTINPQLPRNVMASFTYSF